MKLTAIDIDITTLDVDAIVNAANPAMRGGGGVDGAIHAAAGPKLLEECIAKYSHGCPVGRARVTGSHLLPAKCVIHTVGPDMREYDNEYNLGSLLLASCYESCMRVASELGHKTIAFPAISTGVYSFNKLAAARIAVNSVLDEMHSISNTVEEVIFACFGGEDTQIVDSAIASHNARIALHR